MGDTSETLTPGEKHHLEKDFEVTLMFARQLHLFSILIVSKGVSEETVELLRIRF